MHPLARLTLAALGLLALAGPAAAQYKVVGPDGKITYTDRPPPPEAGRAAPLPAAAPRSEAPNVLPLELRQASSRYPVTLYTSAACPPCDSGRRLLRERGIPYAERLINTEDDAEAMQRLTGGRTVPSITIGTQALRGWSETDWGAYLDAAGYPRESRLPRGWREPVATPLVERQAEPPARPAPGGRAAARAAAAEEAAAAAPPPPPPAASGIRF